MQPKERLQRTTLLLAAGAWLAAGLAVLSIEAPNDGGVAQAQIVPAPLARLVIRNDGDRLIRGRVRGPGPFTRAFAVPVGSVREMVLATGEAVIEVDADPPVVRRVTLEQGEVEEFEYRGRR